MHFIQDAHGREDRRTKKQTNKKTLTENVQLSLHEGKGAEREKKPLLYHLPLTHK